MVAVFCRGEARLSCCGLRAGGGAGAGTDWLLMLLCTEDVCQQIMSILPVKLLYVPRPEAGGGAGHGRAPPTGQLTPGRGKGRGGGGSVGPRPLAAAPPPHQEPHSDHRDHGVDRGPHPGN